jgi:hypothetical protein
MGEEQYKTYLMYRGKENTENQFQSNKPNKPLSLPGSEKGGAKTYFVKSRMQSIFNDGNIASKIAIDHNIASTSEITIDRDIAFTKENGPKLHLIAERVAEGVGCDLVYSQFVERGLNKETKYLDLKDFRPLEYKITGSMKNKVRVEDENGNILYDEEDYKTVIVVKSPDFKQYAIISGDIPQEQRDVIVFLQRLPANKRGMILKCVLVSKTGAEGLDLKYIRRIHQVEPYWDKARDKQVIGRGVRLGSHLELSPEERNVQPYLYIAIANEKAKSEVLEEFREEKTIDEIFYERANKKYELNEQFRNLLKEVSIEGGENCKTCMPTNEQLFYIDPSVDLTLSNPCKPMEEFDLEVKEIEYKGIKYYYESGGHKSDHKSEHKSEKEPTTFYVYDEHLGGHISLDASDPINIELSALISIK